MRKAPSRRFPIQFSCFIVVCHVGLFLVCLAPKLSQRVDDILWAKHASQASKLDSLGYVANDAMLSYQFRAPDTPSNGT